MYKHKYQAIDVKSVDWTILRKHSQGQSLVFAVDVAKGDVRRLDDREEGCGGDDKMDPSD